MPQADNSFQVMDTIDLVYGSIFGFIEPRVAWRSTKSELYVLRYPQAYNGLDIFVSIGFTNPDYGSSAIKIDNSSGLLVLNPIGFSEKFPVANGYGLFNMLLGVTKRELEIAKAQDNYVVADALFKKGYVNYMPIKRESVL